MRRAELIINYGVILGPVVLALCISYATSFVYAWPTSSAVLLVASLVLSGVLLIYAKLPTLGQRKLFAFGLSSIDPSRKIHYLLAYSCLFLGFTLSIATVLTSKI